MSPKRRRSAALVEEEQAVYHSSGTQPKPRFLEFFAGGGMARAALQPVWESAWANDFSPEKALVYKKNWGEAGLVVGDVARVDSSQLPHADMAWGSFPCQDLSLAGHRAGIGKALDENKSRSGSFWPFWRLILAKQPAIVVLENVVGTLSSNDGHDFLEICSALTSASYSFGPIVMDASLWVPQSRPRLFIIAVHTSHPISAELHQPESSPLWHNQAVTKAYVSIPPAIRKSWIWWDMPGPSKPVPRVEKLIDENPTRWVTWDSDAKTKYLLGLMTERHREKIRKAQLLNHRIIGFAYRRTRDGEQRAEIRFDGVAGCLRTAAGGSSKQIVFEINGNRVRSRLLSPREAARLQGLPDDYWLPDSYNDAYDVVGDGLCVPVVRFLGEQLLTPLALAKKPSAQAIA